MQPFPRSAFSLPLPPTPLIGREHEVEEVRGRLARDDVRLLTLTGTAGTGKTRLALAVAAALTDTFEDGIFFVDLAPVRDPDLVATAIAQVLGVRETAGQPLWQSLQDYLADRQLLLILDNVEHLLAVAPRVAGLLASCPGPKVLATSREPLHLRWEHEFPVPLLAVADPRHATDPERLADIAAVALFVARARAANPAFTLTQQNGPALAAICRALDGLPLAIDLAAARVKLLPPQAMLARLGHRLDLLTGGARDLPARHQTLRAAIAWSYDLIEADEQALFRRLGAFVGGFTLEAAEAVGAHDTDGAGIVERLASLVDKSLVQQEDRNGEPRLRLLETIREYAWEQLAAHGELDATRRQHATYFQQSAEEDEPDLGGEPRLAWLARAAIEQDNLRTALQWAVESSEASIALRLAGALRWFWYFRGLLSEGRGWLERVLALPDAQRWPALRAKALFSAGALARDQGDAEAARRLLEESREIWDSVEDQRGVACALMQLGLTADQEGDAAEARSLLEESVDRFRAIGYKQGLGDALMCLGTVHAKLPGHEATARRLLDESLALFHELGDRWRLSGPLYWMGVVAGRRGDTTAARSLIEQSLAIFSELGDKWRMALALDRLGEMARAARDYRRAAAYQSQALAVSRDLGNRRWIAECLEDFGELALLRQQPARAARLLGAAEALRDASGAALLPSEQPAYEEAIAGMRSALGGDAFLEAWGAGRLMSTEQAVQYALLADEPAAAADAAGAAGAHESTAPSTTALSSLTPRELEALRLLVGGKTNREIAATLFVSVPTVERHLANIYGKLGVRGRTEAAALAARAGLASG